MEEIKACFWVDGEDFSDCVKVSGLKWKKSDLDDEKSGRTQDTVMHRYVKGKKRQLTVTCKRLEYARGHALAVALDKPFVQIKFLDLRLGVITKTMYGTDIEATEVGTVGSKTYFDNTKFTLVEQ